MGEMNNNMTLFIQTKDGEMHKLENCSVSFSKSPDEQLPIWKKIMRWKPFKMRNKAYSVDVNTNSWSINTDKLELR